jgi:hypothetical protein
VRDSRQRLHSRQLAKPGKPDTTLTSSNMRFGKHEVIVGLALASSPPLVHVVARAMFTPNFAGPPTPALITAGTGEQIALAAVNQQIVRFQLPQAFVVAP